MIDAKFVIVTILNCPLNRIYRTDSIAVALRPAFIAKRTRVCFSVHPNAAF